MSNDKKLEYRPDMAPHVVGRYEPRVFDAEEGRWEEQVIELSCEHPACKAVAFPLRRKCDSGRVREHVARFALGHIHRDPFAGNPGSQA